MLELWAATLLPHGTDPPFRNSTELYSTIDATPLGAVKWESFEIRYPQHAQPADNVPAWMTTGYDVWFRDVWEIARGILKNPEFQLQIDYGPRRIRNALGERQLRNFMSGEWAWDQAVSFGN